MNRLTALLLAAALWGGIFLPGLGSTEMKGEEARRVMPAITMLEGGSWLVPNVGGLPYLRKPPLVQWCIAGSMKVFGHNTFAARFPSALSVLALAMVMILATRGWLIAEQSLLVHRCLLVAVSIGAVLGVLLLTDEWSLARRIAAGVVAGAGVGILITAPRIIG